MGEVDVLSLWGGTSGGVSRGAGTSPDSRKINLNNIEVHGGDPPILLRGNGRGRGGRGGSTPPPTAGGEGGFEVRPPPPGPIPFL